MSRDVHGLVTMIKAWWKECDFAKSDPETVPLPFNEKVNPHIRLDDSNLARPNLFDWMIEMTTSIY